MSSIAAGTTLTTALVATGDTSGELLLKTGPSATTALSIDTSGNVAITGDLTYNNGQVPLPKGTAIVFSLVWRK